MSTRDSYDPVNGAHSLINKLNNLVLTFNKNYLLFLYQLQKNVPSDSKHESKFVTRFDYWQNELNADPASDHPRQKLSNMLTAFNNINGMLGRQIDSLSDAETLVIVQGLDHLFRAHTNNNADSEFDLQDEQACLCYINDLRQTNDTQEDAQNFWNAFTGLIRLGALVNIKASVPGLDCIVQALEPVAEAATSQKVMKKKLKSLLQTKSRMKRAVEEMMAQDVDEEKLNSMLSNLSTVMSTLPGQDSERNVLTDALGTAIDQMFGDEVPAEFKTGLTNMFSSPNTVNSSALEQFFEEHAQHLNAVLPPGSMNSGINTVD